MRQVEGSQVHFYRGIRPDAAEFGNSEAFRLPKCLMSLRVRAPRVLSVIPLLAALAVPLACAQSGKPAPEWPEQPLPAYPSADQEVAPREGPLKAESGRPAAAAPSGQLAKQYAGRATVDEQKGQASYYSDSLAGNHTASGDVYDPRKHTAAHRKLPFGTVVRVTRVDTGGVTYVTINDRGPFGSSERIIDLSRVAAEDLAMMKAGVVKVLVEVLDKGD
jgi:rare lipoprotein A